MNTPFHANPLNAPAVFFAAPFVLLAGYIAWLVVPIVVPAVVEAIVPAVIDTLVRTIAAKERSLSRGPAV